jgi:hypothetical protein
LWSAPSCSSSAGTNGSAEVGTGDQEAFVQGIDPPSQSIWLGERDGRLEKLKQLGEDVDWCNTIVWSADSSTVAYLIQDARLVTVNARSRQIVSEHWLTDPKTGYPTAIMVKNLSLSADGHRAIFRECHRDTSSGGYVHAANECSEPVTRTIR